MNAKKVLNMLNKIVNKIVSPFGVQIVSVPAGRFIDMTKHLQEKNGALNLFDLVICRELRRLNGKSFNIVQIGANDGSRYDPYREYIEKHKFTGVLVEPNPNVFKKLVKNYVHQPQLYFENVAVGKENCEMMLYVFDVEEGVDDVLSVYASLDEKSVKFFKKKLRTDVKIKPIKVPVLTYQQLLEKNHLDSVSLLAIDVEGYDFEIIKTIDFKINAPKIIDFEHGCINKYEEKKCQDYLISNGYYLYRSFGENTIAVKNLAIL